MAFTVNDYSDLVRLLAQHPEWQAELRRLLLADDFLALPAIVRDLAETQRRSEERLAGVEDRLARLETAVVELAEAQRRTEAAIQSLADGHKRMGDVLSGLKGRVMEMDYRDKVVAYFGRLLRQPQVVSLNSIWESLEAQLAAEALDDVLLLDLVVQGRPRQQPEAGEVWLAVEVSAVIDQGDVERADRRAALLRKAGYRAIPVVAGEGLTEGATQLLQDRSVVLVLDGRSQGWDEALAALSAR